MRRRHGFASSTETGAPPAPPVFEAASTRSLKKAGLEGRPIRVEYQDGSLVLTGARSGRVVCAAAQVRHMRIGSEDSKHGRFHEWRISIDGQERSLVLIPQHRYDPGYASAVRAFSSALARAGRLDRMETGLSPARALFLPIAFGVLLLAALGVALFALGNEPWWGRLIVPALPAVILVFAIRQTIADQWPRPVRELTEVERGLR